MSSTAGSFPTSEHFVVEQIADGVYAAMARDEGAAFCNAGIVDLGDKTLIFDTFETPRAAEDLKGAAEELTGRPATYVVNSHFHPDHWFGNQVFADQATIIATRKTRELMFEVAAEIGSYKDDPDQLQAILDGKKAELEAAADDRRRATLNLVVARWEYALESLPFLDFHFPSQAFEQRLVFHGSGRPAELITKGSGHTASDAYLWLPADRVLFMGDLGFFQREPFMTNCHLQTWVAQLEELEQSDVEIFVPGHGPRGTRADIAEQQHYMIVLQALVAHVLQSGGALEEALQQPLPHPFDTWSAEGLPLADNVRLLYNCLVG